MEFAGGLGGTIAAQAAKKSVAAISKTLTNVFFIVTPSHLTAYGLKQNAKSAKNG
jgi:ABC-type sugar transport system substrate-binding protein